jgi:hypothetical protein
VSAVYAQQFIPNLCIPATQAGVGNCPLNQGGNNTQFTNDAYQYFTQAGKKFWVYNDGRPGVGSSMTEDDGVAFRTFPWAQFKMGIDRWFYWYANVNSNIDMLATATSWGDRTRFDSQRGMWGDHAPSNGNGLLVYPGTDIGHTQNSYGLAGPIASLRLKQWRRGIQDTDYLALAMQKNPAATKALIQTIMPKGIMGKHGPGCVLADRSHYMVLRSGCVGRRPVATGADHYGWQPSSSTPTSSDWICPSSQY